jgi:hypothetical protein
MVMNERVAACRERTNVKEFSVVHKYHAFFISYILNYKIIYSVRLRETLNANL